MASSAIAATTPWWRSLASTLRVPKSTVNTAMPTAIQKPIWNSEAPSCAPVSVSGPLLLMTWKLVATAFSCSAMYGAVLTTAISVTSAARLVLLP